MKATALGLIACVLASVGWTSVCPAEPFVPIPDSGLLVLVDWQDPAFLPRRFRNHCSFDPARGRYYCSNHCGFDYQFYYCSRESFGCCHVGRGYCDWSGFLRCSP
jgi:hypothetical protein